MSNWQPIRLIWVSPAGFIHDAIGGVVRLATGGQYAHCAIGLYLPEYNDDVIVEMLMPSIKVQDFHKYDNEKLYYAVDIGFERANYEKLQDVIRGYIQMKRRYGLIEDCLAGGVSSIISTHIGDEVAEHWAERFKTSNCSELLTEAVRIQYPQYLFNRRASAVTPEDTLMSYFDLATEISKGAPE